MRSKELKTYNLPKDELVIAQIDAKPNMLFFLAILMGILSIVMKYPVVFGAMIILVSICAIIYMPRALLMEFYQEYLVLYNRADKNNCVLIYYDEISSWYYSWSASRDYLCIELENGTTEKIEAFSKTIFESNMNRFLKDKHRKNVK